MIWSTTPDGYHDYYNQRWYDFTCVPPGSTDGEGWAGMFHPEDQERACTLYEALKAFPETADSYRYALAHRGIIRRFGRFPHRNQALGRKSTPEEIEFLKLPGSSF